MEVAHDESRGVHLRVRQNHAGPISRQTCVIKTPLPVTMSYLNAINYHPSAKGNGGHISSSPGDSSVAATDVSLDNTPFSAHGLVFPRAFIDSVSPDEVTIFFLMGQYLKGDRGFWYPYLRSLPQPGSLSTPLYYEGEDLEWLAGTSLVAAREHRLHAWKEKFRTSFGKLREAGFNDEVEKFTWYACPFRIVLAIMTMVAILRVCVLARSCLTFAGSSTFGL